MAKGSEESSFQIRDQEETAYNTWREWPVFLELRRKELLAHHAPVEGQTDEPTPQSQGSVATALAPVTGS